MYGQKSGLEAAVAAAAKVDASLHAKGKLTKTVSIIDNALNVNIISIYFPFYLI